MESTAWDIQEIPKCYVFQDDAPGLTKYDIQISNVNSIQRTRYLSIVTTNMNDPHLIHVCRDDWMTMNVSKSGEGKSFW